MAGAPGLVALFGSGETSASGRKVYEMVFSRLTSPVRVAVLETPAGFQPNSALVAQKVGDFLRLRLQNYRPEVAVLPARRRHGPFSPDDPDIIAPMLHANAIFLGPGSPTYAVRQLQDSLAWGYLQTHHRMGAAVLLASAATIAASLYCLPVYEIYKVGEDPHWRPGLDMFGPFGLSLAFVPHWNNNEGGSELDTSRCFMGVQRFGQLLDLLPDSCTVVGIDEHTALVVDPAGGRCQVMGRGGVTLMREGAESRHASGHSFPVELLGPFRLPMLEERIPPQVWNAAVEAREQPPKAETGPPAEVLALVQARERVRAAGDWPAADAMRQQIAELGWRVLDTPVGPALELA